MNKRLRGEFLSKLEYIMVYLVTGLPIYSKCFSKICGVAFREPALLSGFLSALENFSAEITQGTRSLQSVKMGDTLMKFNRTLPTGHSVVIGLTEDDEGMVDTIFETIRTIVEIDFKGKDWSIVNEEFEKEFAYALYKRLEGPLQKYGGFHDECPLGDKSLFKTVASSEKKTTIWQRIKENYRIFRERRMTQN